MDLQGIKDELKEMYPNMQGFIQHTLVAEMCLKWHEKQVKNCSIPDVSARLSSSLGECVEGNDYEIVADKDGRFWINHKEVGSGEPLVQWIDRVLNVS